MLHYPCIFQVRHLGGSLYEKVTTLSFVFSGREDLILSITHKVIVENVLQLSITAINNLFPSHYKLLWYLLSKDFLGVSFMSLYYIERKVKVKGACILDKQAYVTTKSN